MARRWAIFAEESRHFMNDMKSAKNFLPDKVPRDLFWILRAAHHFRNTCLNGSEVLPPEGDDPEPLVACLAMLRQQQELPHWQPKPRTGPDYYPLVYEVHAESEKEASIYGAALSLLNEVRFSRGGCLEVLEIPEHPWQRSSEQDGKSEKDPFAMITFARADVPKRRHFRMQEHDHRLQCEQDKWAWGTLMPLYFREVGEREQQWRTDAFPSRWRFGRQLVALRRDRDSDNVQTHFGCPGHKLFARHAAVAVLDVQPARVRIFSVFQPRRKPNEGGDWALPGGNCDRARDKSWMDAALREWEEEVNPAGDPAYSAPNAFDTSSLEVISLQNLVRGGSTLNMSRPCLNFLVARAHPAFVAATEHAAEHKDGGRQLQLPEDFATELAHLQKDEEEENALQLYRHWTEGIPFLEHDRFQWVDLDLDRGSASTAHGGVHSYIAYVAAALRHHSVPREELRALDYLRPPGSEQIGVGRGYQVQP